MFSIAPVTDSGVVKPVNPCAVNSADIGVVNASGYIFL
jgi:hypothetical protein